MRLNLALLGLFIMALMISVQAQNTYIPYELGGDNYYTMYGGPDITASVAGTNEFERGDTVGLYVDLTNFGRILGFKEDRTPQNEKEYALANAELEEEYKKPTALGISASLHSNSQQITVKSGSQVVEALTSGARIQTPLRFTIKIAEHAPAGVYPLMLNLSYNYQDNVRVDASKLTTGGIMPTLSNFRASYIYHDANQTIPISIVVKKQADFKIEDAKVVIEAGAKKAEVRVTYKNTGEDPVKDAVARLSIFKPFSSTDDQALVGSMKPNEERGVVFRLDVDPDATPKEYGINSEIKYKDVNGDTIISESMKIPVVVTPASQNLILPGSVLLIIIVAAGGYMYRKKQKKAR